MLSIADYAQVSGGQLYRLARDRKIVGRGRMTREELIAAIRVTETRG